MRFWKRLRFALRLTDLDLENINWMCDRILVDSQRPVSARMRGDLDRLHDMSIDAS